MVVFWRLKSSVLNLRVCVIYWKWQKSTRSSNLHQSFPNGAFEHHTWHFYSFSAQFEWGAILKQLLSRVPEEPRSVTSMPMFVNCNFIYWKWHVADGLPVTWIQRDLRLLILKETWYLQLSVCKRWKITFSKHLCKPTALLRLVSSVIQRLEETDHLMCWLPWRDSG